jgi:fructokinase
MYLVGIDLGGTKIEGAVLDPAKPTQPLCRLRVPTEAEKGYEHIVQQIAHLHAQLKEAAGVDLPPTLGIGTPGFLNAQGDAIAGSNTQCLNKRPLRTDLEKILKCHVQMANDANCFALAESTLGAAQGYETVFGIIMGTGVGGGLIAHNRILNGRHGIAGEWGQIILDPSGPVSKHGTRGSIEAFLCGPALENWYEEQCGTRRLLKEIHSRAQEGSDVTAVQTIERLVHYFVQSINMILNVYDPHAIVIGGGVGNIDALYSENTRQRLSQIMFASPLQTTFLRPTLGDSAGVFGAAMLTQNL